MDQPINRFGFSSIPRISRMPVSRGSEKTQNGPITHTLKSRALLGEALQNDDRDAIPLDAPSARASQILQPSVASKGIDAGPRPEDTSQDQVEASARVRTLPRRPRPSLSDRAIETLSQIPPSPSPRRRKSGFFPSENPEMPSARPTSSLRRSRPSTSHGQHPPLPSGFPTPRSLSPTKRPLVPGTGNQIPITTPSKRAVSSYAPSSLPPSSRNPHNTLESTPSKSGLPALGKSVLACKAGNTITGKSSSTQLRGSKTLAARPSKARPSVQDAFAKPAPKANRATKNHSTEATNPTLTSLSPSKRAPQTSTDPTGSPKVPASSAALRETIAKAKAARRDINRLQSKEPAKPVPKTNSFPNVEIGGGDEDLLRKRVATARAGGRLNIAALELTEMPCEVMNMYSSNIGDGAWYESVDLVRLIAADNNFEHFDDNVFPDDATEAPNEDDDYQGNMFGGLETLDLHNNHLKSIPMGLRRLERLTTLNLSKNNLGNDSLQIIGQMLPLRELRLGENALEGTLGSQFCSLSNLEVLDLHDNGLSALSSDLQDVSSLRVLNVAGNKLASVPFDSLAFLPLAELNVARNRLNGSLFPSSIDGLPQLKALDVASNALTSLTNDRLIHLASLQDLNVTENRLKTLPDISGWAQLLTLTAGGNKLNIIPEGLTSLRNLRTVDFSRNELKMVDEGIGLMESLTVLRVANNPLRERKFLTMDTGEIKCELRSRIHPTDSPDVHEDNLISYDGSGSAPSKAAGNPGSWPVKAGGILDRSATKLGTIDPSEFRNLTQDNDIKTLILRHNVLPHIPPAVVFSSHTLKNLDISHNKLASAKYLFTEMLLPNLTCLDASFNGITSLAPLLEYLSAPNLAELNVSRNRLTTLPPLRVAFSALKTVYASDNSISKLPVESVKGLQVLNVSGNNINHLEPKLGLLDAEGLRTLVLGGNTFRVPRKDVLDKGTVAVLAWLKSRISEDEMLGLG